MIKTAAGGYLKYWEYGGSKMSIYLITGATGYIGSMLVKDILKQSKDNTILAPVRNVHKADKMLMDEVEIIQADLTDESLEKKLPSECDYIIHCASITSSIEMISHPVEAIRSIVNATQNVLEYARRCSVKSMVYLSSMEVYGNIDCSDGHRVSEQEQGEIEIGSVRSCYPLGKRMAENICYCYFKEYGIPVKTARLAQTFGQGILPGDNRVFAQIARAVKQEKDIVLHTEGNSMGNYCGIHDAIAGIWMILKHGVNGEAYNVVNEANTMRIQEMAKLAAQEVAHGRIKVKVELEDAANTGYAPDTGLRLSAEKLQRLGWKPTENIITMYREAMI